MIKLHVKSPCCKAIIQRFGSRRRRCSACHSTWRIRKKKRGRKKIRTDISLIQAYFQKDIPNIRSLARTRNYGRDHAQMLLRRSLMKYVTQYLRNWSSSLPLRGPLIAIADAIWHRVNGEKITIYLILLRPVDSDIATIALPVFAFGHETGEGWTYAWQQIPDAYKRRVCGLVCDGQWWLIAFGYRNGWVVQRCQFHLLANLQMYLGIRDRQRNSRVLTLVYGLFAASSLQRSRRILGKLAAIRDRSKSRGMRRVLSGLETNYCDFQSYLHHPELNLPTTTNAAESCVSGVRELMRRCRGFRSMNTLQLWLTGYILWKKTIRCNGKNQPN